MCLLPASGAALVLREVDLSIYMCVHIHVSIYEYLRMYGYMYTYLYMYIYEYIHFLFRENICIYSILGLVLNRFITS
jgi:hypothetical protein